MRTCFSSPPKGQLPVSHDAPPSFAAFENEATCACENGATQRTRFGTRAADREAIPSPCRARSRMTTPWRAPTDPSLYRNAISDGAAQMSRGATRKISTLGGRGFILPSRAMLFLGSAEAPSNRIGLRAGPTLPQRPRPGEKESVTKEDNKAQDRSQASIVTAAGISDSSESRVLDQFQGPGAPGVRCNRDKSVRDHCDPVRRILDDEPETTRRSSPPRHHTPSA